MVISTIKKGRREENPKGFPQNEVPHDVPEEKLIATFGEGNYKSMPDEICWQLRFEPARWTAEEHVIKVYVGTDGLHQDEFLRGDCLAHARHHFTNAVKAMGKGNQEAVKSSAAYKALVRIGAIYKLEEALKDLSPEERLKERQASIRPLVEEYFAWVKETLAGGTILPKSETAKGLQYSVNQKAYQKVFLTDGEVPIDDSALERVLRNFTIGRKNWMTELPQLVDENGNIEQSMLEPLMPWSKILPADCYSKRRN